MGLILCFVRPSPPPRPDAGSADPIVRARAACGRGRATEAAGGKRLTMASISL
jgi:hypothetical protein